MKVGDNMRNKISVQEHNDNFWLITSGILFGISLTVAVYFVISLV